MLVWTLVQLALLLVMSSAVTALIFMEMVNDVGNAISGALLLGGLAWAPYLVIRALNEVRRLR
jgi:hypothetical protein